MKNNGLSYAEAYTEFLKYCSKKERVDVDKLVFRFKDEGIEKKFKQLYNENSQISSGEYYKRLRGR